MPFGAPLLLQVLLDSDNELTQIFDVKDCKTFVYVPAGEPIVSYDKVRSSSWCHPSGFIASCAPG